MRYVQEECGQKRREEEKKGDGSIYKADFRADIAALAEP
jgi:hypothetical protein